ncbi:hypothetical protein AB0H82_13985 [Streptomyces sp. NPDC050732]|uniref:hypothetical protein n=1 Tax=Streptomyces sp. NPDC050732 TaxID=3154632 RepID=UPI0034213012
MSSRHAVAIAALAVALVGGVALPGATAVASPGGAAVSANPIPLPVVDTLINEGVSVEGPLINNIVLPNAP